MYYKMSSQQIQQNQKIACDPLSEPEYAKCFRTFLDRSHEYDYMLNIVDYIETKSDGSTTILSIGAGTGYFDEQVLNKLKHKVNYYALEPNPIHITELTERLNKTTHNIKIIQDYFSTSSSFDLKFDYILISHCLYPIRNPFNVLHHAISFLNDDKSKLLLFHQGDVGMVNFVNKFNKFLKFSSEPYAKHDYSSKDIIEYLKYNHIKHDLYLLPAYIDLSDVFTNEELLHDMVTFYIQTNTKLLPKELFDEMVEDIKAHTMSDMKYNHPTGMIIISND